MAKCQQQKGPKTYFENDGVQDDEDGAWDVEGRHGRDDDEDRVVEGARLGRRFVPEIK